MTRLLARRLAFLSAFLLALQGSALAAIAPEPSPRFGSKVIYDPVASLGIAAEAPDQIPDFADGAQGWAAFKAAHGGWDVRIDRRSGAPILAQGPGIAWYDPAEQAPGLDALEAKARAFIGENSVLFRVSGSQLVLNRQASGMWDADRGLIAFDRVVDGVPVEGQRFALYVVRGRMVSFGADRWGAIERAPRPVYGVETARELLREYAGIGAGEAVEELEAGTLVLVPSAPDASVEPRWTGPVGRGLGYRLAWRFALRVAGEPGTWVGKVDALTGDVVSFYDDDKYAQVKGGVYPVASDGDCSKGGCERDNFPMPYANLTVNGGPVTTNDQGIFECTGGNASTSLLGPYVVISDACGAVNESVACDADLDLMSGPAGQTNCSVNAGESAGNTHASRTAFYTINRIKEKGRYWLPANGWLQGSVQVNTNVNSTCNASWGGQLNMYRAGGGCRNTAETAGVLNHEYGHGLDQNDGGGYDNPSEGYADVTAIISDRASCVGRGFYESQVCSGYGDTCLSCTGIRDMDWNARTAHTPATPSGFTQNNCGGGGGPCGREVHCESYVPSEAVYDLAARDLPAAGLDQVSAWQMTEKLFYKSRNGSTGNVFNCSLPSSDGCNANGWFNTMRVADDDDGNLSNGTPHAAAIFAAFNRHKIACGAANDASNQNSSSCPSLQAPTVTASNGSAAVNLSWSAVPNASHYLILRTEVSCDFTQNVIATVDAPATTYVDADLANGFTYYYRVQAQGGNTACDAPVSSCVQGTPQPFAGTIKLDRPAYACSGTMQITVVDANIGAPTTTARVTSTTEPAFETVVLTETAPGSGKYVGTIATTGGPAVPGDGAVSIADGDAISASYTDADDGEGGTNLVRTATALGDCRAPLLSQAHATNISDVQATVQWMSDENASSVVHWGELKPPSQTTSAPGRTTQHSVNLTGLHACTIYWYSVEGDDVAGNLATDTNGGQYYYFETLGNLGSGLQACHAGQVTIDKSVASCSDVLPLKVTDLDLNVNPSAIDTVQVRVTSTTETAPEVVTLTETGANTSRFLGSIPTASGPAVPGDGVLQTSDGDVLTATYDDADDGTGAPAVSFDTADADCASPSTSSIRVVSLNDESVQIQWTTSEPTTGRVDWGTTPALGSVVTDNVLRTTHTLQLNPIAECGRIYFRVTSTDAYANARVFDAAGAPFEANAYRIPPGIFKDSFEGSSGWTMDGEWQIDAPHGLGTAPADPGAAFEGTKVLGLDLTGSGARPGDYELGTFTRATSPAVNATTLQNGQLRFRRWLNVGDGAIASIDVRRNGQTFTVWDSTSNSESSWSLQTVNISAAADGAQSLQIVFKLKANALGTTRSGWNLDRFIINSANQPSFEACGGCTGAPTFEGAVKAADANPCADTGVTVSWHVAPAWGTGGGGTYAIYRSTNPAFTPSPASLIADGLAGTSYDDTTAPNDVTLYYIVRAENGESCGQGPNNGGLTDANLVRVAARDETTQSAAGDVGAGLLVDPVNEAHVRLSWPATAGAAKYNVYRSQQPSSGFSKLDETTATYYEDLNQMGNFTTWYYLVRGVNACGVEGP